MRPMLFATAAAALLGAAGAAAAQTPDAPFQAQGRVLSWPGKRAPAPAPVEAAPVAEPQSGFSMEPAPVPAPFVATSTGPARINNRYSARTSAPRMIASLPTRPAYPPVVSANPYADPAAAAPAYPVMEPYRAPAPASVVDYGPPVIPNMVKPAARQLPAPVQAAPIVAAPAAPAPVYVPPAVVAAPMKVAPAVTAKVKPAAATVQAAPVPAPPVVVAAPGKTAAPSANAKAQPAPVAATVAAAPTPVQAGDRPFIRPATANGPRFYSVHREYGGTPDATWRSKPTGAPATERLPGGFFASTEAPAEETTEEVQDDAETRAAALRAAEKATKAKRRRR